MTRLLMEEAKRYTQSNRVSDLIPDLRARRQNRMQSIQMSNTKNYPTLSEVPAEELPSRDTANRLVEIFKQKGELKYFHRLYAHELTLDRPGILADFARSAIRERLRRRL